MEASLPLGNDKEALNPKASKFYDVLKQRRQDSTLVKMLLGETISRYLKFVDKNCF